MSKTINHLLEIMRHIDLLYHYAILEHNTDELFQMREELRNNIKSLEKDE